MCGFIGVLNLDRQPVDKDTLIRMRDILYHRGPDDAGLFLDDNAGLGFRRLSIIDLNSGHQPMSNDDESIWIVFNGEIYNYVELREDLQKKGYRFRTKSDTEVIIRLYEEYGENCLQYLNGMFAFVIWDKRKNELFAARDRVGVKPLYYYFDGHRFVCASEIKAIIEDRSIRREPDYEAIMEYLSFMYTTNDKTFFKGIKKLMPGYYLKATGGKINIRQYWDLQYNYADKTEKQFTEELTSLLEDAVRIHLRSDVPLGCHLSGGLDSSTVACLAARNLPQSIKTFSGKFDESEFYDETYYAKIVSRAAGTEYLETTPTWEYFAQSIAKIVWHMDEPCVGPGIFPQYCVCQLAGKNVKVVLGGQGGDEIFGGYPRYFMTLDNVKEGHGNTTTPRYPKRSVLQRAVANWTFVLNYAKQHGALTTLKKIRAHTNQAPSSLDEYWKKISMSMMQDSPIFSQELRQRFSSYDLDSTFCRYIRMDNTDDIFDKILYHDFKVYLPGLLQVEDRTSMSVSLESRVPILDYRMVELAATIPPHIKVKDFEPKYIFKQAIKNTIPKEVWRRKDKKGFPTPINVWFKKQLAGYLESVLLDNAARERGLFDPGWVAKAMHWEEDYSWPVWSLLNVELWFKIFIDEDQRFIPERGKVC